MWKIAREAHFFDPRLFTTKPLTSVTIIITTTNIILYGLCRWRRPTRTLTRLNYVGNSFLCLLPLVWVKTCFKHLLKLLKEFADVKIQQIKAKRIKMYYRLFLLIIVSHREVSGSLKNCLMRKIHPHSNLLRKAISDISGYITQTIIPEIYRLYIITTKRMSLVPRTLFR